MEVNLVLWYKYSLHKVGFDTATARTSSISSLIAGDSTTQKGAPTFIAYRATAVVINSRLPTPNFSSMGTDSRERFAEALGTKSLDADAAALPAFEFDRFYDFPLSAVLASFWVLYSRHN